MSKSPVITIKELIGFLPAKDIKFAEKFISARDFESLKELVDSAIIRVRRSQNSASPKPEYADIDLSKLEELKVQVDAYLLLLGVPEEEVFEDEDLGEVEDGQDTYFEGEW